MRLLGSIFQSVGTKSLWVGASVVGTVVASPIKQGCSCSTSSTPAPTSNDNQELSTLAFYTLLSLGFVSVYGLYHVFPMLWSFLEGYVLVTPPGNHGNMNSPDNHDNVSTLNNHGNVNSPGNHNNSSTYSNNNDYPLYSPPAYSLLPPPPPYSEHAEGNTVVVGGELTL